MDALKNLKFSDGDGGGGFIKFEAGKPLKLRVFTTDPVINIDQFGNTRYSFAVWDYSDGKAKILSKGTSIARPIAELHNDEDYGANITKQDIKITATGDGMERRYTINVLPKPNNLTSEARDELEKLDGKLDTIIKNGLRASAFNDGQEIPKQDTSMDEITDVPEDDDELKRTLNDIGF